MNQDIIDKLPPDVQKEYMKMAIKLSEKEKQIKVHDDFLTFVRHVWPEFIVFDQAILFAAIFKSALSSTIQGDLPPSSSVTGVKNSAAERITIFPNSLPPVKNIWSKRFLNKI